MAILRLFQPMLMEYTDLVDALHELANELKHMFDPSRIWAQVKRINPELIISLREKFRPKVEDTSRMKDFSVRSRENESVTKFHKRELKAFWTEYLAIDPYFKYGMAGMDYEMFSRMISGTFSHWSAGNLIISRLFSFFDKDNNGHVDFWEIIAGLSVMCRGSFEEKSRFTFDLYDIDNQGKLDRANLRRLLMTVYSPFYNEHGFIQLTTDLVNEAFSQTAEEDRLSIDEFTEAMEQQPTVLSKYHNCGETLRQPFDVKKTFYYWVFDIECPTFSERLKIEVPKEMIVSSPLIIRDNSTYTSTPQSCSINEACEATATVTTVFVRSASCDAIERPQQYTSYVGATTASV